jgi:hypothetical protein
VLTCLRTIAANPMTAACAVYLTTDAMTSAPPEMTRYTVEVFAPLPTFNQNQK